jgi:hypothetical protein
MTWFVLVPLAAADGAGQKTYILKSLLPLELRQRFVEPPKTASLKGFAAVVLCLIHLAQDSISEGKDVHTQSSFRIAFLTDEVLSRALQVLGPRKAVSISLLFAFYVGRETLALDEGVKALLASLPLILILPVNLSTVPWKGADLITKACCRTR